MGAIDDPADDGDDAGVDGSDAAAEIDAAVDATPRCGNALEYGGHCYELRSELRSWVEAQAACVASGGYLVTYKSAAEQAAVVAGVVLPDDAWIGLKQESSQNFVWVTGEPLGFTNWEPEQPSGNGGCVEQDVKSGQWNDYDCGDGKPFICEREPK